MKKISKLLLCLLTVGLLIGATYPHVGAQSNGLGITPRKDYTIDKGDTVQDTIFINNLSQDQMLTLRVRAVDFKAQDESGSPALDRRQGAEPTPWSARPFITLPETLTIEAGKSVQMPITITMPGNQGAGSYYSAIEYEAQNEGGQNVSVAASSATLIFIKVPGEVRQLMTLEQFGAYQSDEKRENGQFKSLFFSSKPNELAYRLKNEGNIAEQPAGSIVIRNMFGKQAAVISDINPKKNLVLLNQTRRVQICMETEKAKIQPSVGTTEIEVDVCKSPIKWPGRYTAELTMLYGENGNNTREINQTVAFWYLPAWFLVIVGVVITAIAGGGYWGYRKVAHHTSRRRR